MTNDPIQMTNDGNRGAMVANGWNLARRKLPIIGSLLVACAALVVAGAAQAAAPRVTEVRIVGRGAVPVDTNSIVAFTSVRAGQVIAQSDLTRDVKEMEKSGRFSFVAAQLEEGKDGVAVIYEVSPKARIRQIEVEGAEILGNKKVRELLELGAGDLVDEATMAYRRLKVKEAYAKKYYKDADLKWTINVDPKTGLADVKVKVEEGKRISVRNISFPGNSTIKPKVLRTAMKQKETDVWSWFTGSGTYNAEDLDADRETLRRLFQDRGLLDVRIGEPVLTNETARTIEIEIPVTEGQQYSIGNFTVKGVTIFSTNEIARVATNKTGDVASMGAIEGTAKRIREYFGNKGYIATQSRPLLSPAAQSNVVDVTIQVTEGRKGYIRDVVIKGNTRTKDEVIRREVTVVPGEAYNEAKVRSSENRLRNLGFFEYVAAQPQDTGDQAQYDLAIQVEEKKTGQLMVGGGFSSIENVFGFVELSEGNFDLFDWPPSGGGQKASIRGSVGAKSSNVRLSFVEPWFMDRKLSLGVDLFREDQRYLSRQYDQLNTGGRLTLGVPIERRELFFQRFNIIYGLENYKIYNVDDDASDLIQQEEGSRLKSSMTFELTHTTVDNFFIPTRGLRAKISAEGAGGPLGGETDMYGFQASATKYVPLWFDHVFSIQGRWATANSYGDSDRVYLYDRLFLGGARTMRGFKYRDVGPKDENGEGIGGLTLAFASLEYTVPIVEYVRFAGFYDYGQVWPDYFETDWKDFNSDWGIGLRLDIPGFPIRLDYAWPLEHDEYNDRSKGRFQFSIGYAY